MLECRSIKKNFGSTPVLKDISLRVDDGEKIVILGPSGSGKTTLLRCISFLEKPDAGDILFDGELYHAGRLSRKDILHYRKKIGYVFQDYQLFANKTALENVTLGLTVGRGMSREAAVSIAERELEKVGMLDRKDFRPSQLSGGQKQRVSIARAMALSPGIILFDEPTSALDPQLTREVLDTMHKVAQEGTTMIVVTHEMAFARQIADRVLFMDGGLIIEENTPEELFTNPKDPRTAAFLSGSGVPA